MRANHKYVEVTGAKGINQQEELADPKTELLDARNLWAPDGKLVQRPGYKGIVRYPPINFNVWGNQPALWPDGSGPYYGEDQSLIYFDGALVGYVYKEDPLGTFTATRTFSSLGVGKRIIFRLVDGSSGNVALTKHLIMLLQFVVAGSTSTNTNGIFLDWEYCDGTVWKPLSVVEIDLANRCRVPNAFNPSYYTSGAYGPKAWSGFCFVMPKDMGVPTSTSVGVPTVSADTYYLRATLRNKGDITFDASVVLVQLGGTEDAQFYYTFAGGVHDYGWCPDGALISYNSKKQLVVLGTADMSAGYGNYPFQTALFWSPNFNLDTINDISIPPAKQTELNIAVIPQFDVSYFAINSIVYTLEPDTRTTDIFSVDTVLAKVETDPLLIGDGAPYDADVVEQLSAFPAAKQIAFYKGQLWAALEDNTVRWSAPIPAYKVWPMLNVEVLPDNNNDAIRALIGFQENMHVFKPDSIWKMVDAGISEFQLQTYAPVKVVSGTGLIAKKGYVVTDNGIFFMSAQGISFFDGVNVKVISQRIRHILDDLSPGNLDKVRAVHWRSRQCVLFAVSLYNSQHNNAVLVYDYKNDSWWLWDDIAVAGWLYDDSDLLSDKLYFIDPTWGIYEFGITYEDHGGAIESYFVSHALGDGEINKRFREIEITGRNVADSVSVTLMVNDEAVDEGINTTVDFTDALEAKWDTAVWGTDTWVNERDRVRRVAFLESGNHCNVRVDHTEKNTPFEMARMKVGMVATGRRR